MARGVEDGYRSQLLPGLKSSDDAARLAQELAFATRRLSLMEQVAAAEPAGGVPEVWHEIAAPGDIDERTLLAARYVLAGPRGLHAGDRLEKSLAGVEAWGARAGSLEAAFSGEPSWAPERRFERTFERLGGVHGLDRDPRYELLTTLGRLGVYDLRPAKLFLRGENEATWAAKRVLGIGDPLLLNAPRRRSRAGLPGAARGARSRLPQLGRRHARRRRAAGRCRGRRAGARSSALGVRRLDLLGVRSLGPVRR